MATRWYDQVYLPNHPRAGTNGNVFVHVIVAEQKIGRYLKPEEVVHHINMNKHDNRPDNLLVVATNSDHAAIHKGCNYELDDDGVAHAIKKVRFCKVCGKTISYGSEMCLDCWHEFLNKNSAPYKIVDGHCVIITRDELKHKIRQKSFVSIGKEFGVCDNTIRKWCKKYNLPFRTKDIKEYTDEEWVNI